jgi:superfamily II DNA or RNA helicase
MDLITSANCWKDFEQSLESLGTKEKGDAFEELTRLHLLTDPTFSIKIKKIWHHSEVPQKIVDELGLQRPEIGVDLVAQVKDGTFWAIQCKFHQDRTKNVTYDEISTFFSITEREKTYPKLSHRLVCTSANGVSRRVAEAHPNKLGYLTSLEFSKLGQDEFDAFRELLDGGHPAPEPYDPREHQGIALDKCESYFKDPKNSRGKIIHPCGSGKSLTGYWISQRLNAKTVLIAVPSLALVRQTLGSWTREAVANGINMDWIAVCSDDDVKNTDDPSMHKVDLGIEVDTDPQVVADFLSKTTKGTKVLITTYQSGQAVSEGVKRSGKTFDLGVYDEAHKTVGQKDKPFSHLLFDENVKVKKRVFMTATEREFKGNSDEYLSMDDPEIYGTIIDELSFKAALEQKEPILSDYKIVTTVVTKSEIEQLINNNNFVKSDGANWTVEGDASTFASLIALRKLIKERNLKHVVSFHSSIKRSKEFRTLNAEATKADDNFGALSTFHVSGKDSTGVRAAELERFVDAEPSLITNARCLTEGVDVPAIDAVLFADPKQSKIDIVQAAGRALRKFDGKDFGYIIVPVVLDEEAEDPSDEAFKQIITVISALGMSDERIIEEFKAIANGKSRGRGRIIDIDVPEVVRVKFAELISNIEIQIWDRLSFGWHKGFEHLKQFVGQNHNARVPQGHANDDGFNLGNWVSSRRKDYNKGTLEPDRIQQLDSIEGWVWDPYEADFHEGLEKLKKYVEQNHNAEVANRYIDDDGFNLGAWVGTRRQYYKKGKLDPDRIQRLESVEGWVWDPDEADFQKGLEKLKTYVEQNLNARVPARYIDDDGFRLGAWVSNRRNDYKKGKLEPDRVRQLDSIGGWIWDPIEADFQEGLEKLKTYVEQNLNARGCANYIDDDGFNLGTWVGNRRQDYKKGKLEPDRVRQLVSIGGWVWDPIEADFQEGLEKLKTYVEQNHNARVTQSHTGDDGFRLGAWVSNRRTDYNKGKLDPDRIRQLESLEGWVWDPVEVDFQEGLEKLKTYVEQNHNARVPATYIDDDGFRLGAWVSNRRNVYKKGKLDPDRIQRLDFIEGWVWDRYEADFHEGLEKLKKYVEQNHNARVPATYIDDDGFRLGGWVHSRRNDYKKGKLEPDRIRQLDSIGGWVWDPIEADFQEGLEKLKTYVEQNHNARVPARYIDDDGFRLGSWVQSRRYDYKKGKLELNLIQRLDYVEGWVWDPFEEDFQVGLGKLKTYVEQNLNARVPKNHTNGDGFRLGAWVSSRRNDYNKGKLDPDRIRQLESLEGWVWIVN